VDNVDQNKSRTTAADMKSTLSTVWKGFKWNRFILDEELKALSKILDNMFALPVIIRVTKSRM